MALRGGNHGHVACLLALVIAAFVAEGEREGVIVMLPAIALYVSAFDKIVGNVAADRNEVC